MDKQCNIIITKNRKVIIFNFVRVGLFILNLYIM